MLEMLHTQLVKLAAPKTPSGASDEMCDYPKAEIIPPTLFVNPPTPESEPESFEEIYDAKFSTLNHQMKTSFTETGNTETKFFWMIDQMSFRQLFRLYAKFGDPSKTGESMTLTCSDKWLRQAKIIDNRRISTTDTGIYFKQTAKFKKALSFSAYENFLALLARKKGLNLSEVKYKMVTCGPPKTFKTTEVDNSSALHRLMERPYRFRDRSQYSRPSHEEFFNNCQCQHGYRSQVVYSRFPTASYKSKVSQNDAVSEDWFPEL